MNKGVTAIAAASILLAGGYLYASPYVTLLQLRSAIETGSAGNIEKFIDFSDVRDSLRSQLIGYLQEQTSKDEINSSLAQFTAGVGGAIGGSLIDTVVQPHNLQKWLDGRQVSGISEDADIQSLNEIMQSDNKPAMIYESFDKFNVIFKGNGLIQAIILERRNLLSWKVVGARISLDVLNSNADESFYNNSALNIIAPKGPAVMSCEDTIESLLVELRDRLQSDKNRMEMTGPRNAYLYLSLYKSGERMEDSSKIDDLFSDDPNMRRYARTVLMSCQNIHAVSFREFDLDGRLVTYELAEDSSVRRCGAYSYEDKPFCAIMLDQGGY